METLKGLLKTYEKSPKMKGAILKAIQEHGPNAEACIVSGLPSFSPNSACYKCAKFLGWKNYEIYPGARVRYKSGGFQNVLVRID